MGSIKRYSCLDRTPGTRLAKNFVLTKQENYKEQVASNVMYNEKSGLASEQSNTKQRAEPETKRTAEREKYQAEPGKKQVAKRQRYWKSSESGCLAKRVRYGDRG